MIRAIIYGCNGKMGQVLSSQLTTYEDFEIAAGIDRNPDKYNNPYSVFSNPFDFTGEADIIIDFSHPSYLEELIGFSVERKIPLVIATTGFSTEQMGIIENASKSIPLLYSSNMSLGINVLSRVLKQVSSILNNSFDIEIIEKHHNKKIDAPSGTAYLLAEAINNSIDNSKSFIYGREGKSAKRTENEIGIHAVRGGTIAGEHTVIFAGFDEVLEFKHTALSKNIFATGAIGAARFLYNKPQGFYTMDDIFDI